MHVGRNPVVIPSTSSKPPSFGPPAVPNVAIHVTGQRQAVLVGATRPVGTPDLSHHRTSRIRPVGTPDLSDGLRSGRPHSIVPTGRRVWGASLAQVKAPPRGAAFPNVAFQRPQSLLLPTYLGDFGPKPPERGAQAHLRAAIPFTFWNSWTKRQTDERHSANLQREGAGRHRPAPLSGGAAGAVSAACFLGR